jgi:hypothetical protein
MSTDNLSVWGCNCWDTKNNRYVLLSYVKETKAEAFSTCRELHPHYDIECVYQIADY